MLRNSLLLMSFAAFSASADVPHTFKAGDPVDAEKFNQNFDSLSQRIDDLAGAETSKPVNRVKRLITRQVRYSPSEPPVFFENSEGLRNATLTRYLQNGCSSSTEVLLDDTHTVRGQVGVNTFFNVPFRSNIRLLCSSSATFNATATIEIEYDE